MLLYTLIIFSKILLFYKLICLAKYCFCTHYQFLQDMASLYTKLFSKVLPPYKLIIFSKILLLYTLIILSKILFLYILIICRKYCNSIHK